MVIDALFQLTSFFQKLVFLKCTPVVGFIGHLFFLITAWYPTA